MRHYIITLTLTLLSAVAVGQTPRETLLGSIESNNQRLSAARELTRARVLEARSGNTLSNPTVGYDYLWGSPSELGKTGELNVVQGFDFPTVYASRSRYARTLAKQYGSEYALLRQQVLLEADLCRIEYACLREQMQLNGRTVDNARRLSQLYLSKAEAGDVGVIELNKVNLELMNALNSQSLLRIDMEACISRLEALNGGEKLDMEQFADEESMPSLPSLDELSARYMEESPELLSMLGAAEAASDKIGVARSEALPKFELGYRREHALGESFNGVKMGMSIPLFEGRYSVKRAKAEQRAANADLDYTRTQTSITLRQLHSKAQLLLLTYQERKVALDPDRTRELLDKALQAGHINVSDYFTELAVVTQSEEMIREIEHQYRQSIAELMMIDL